jgi:hypothetical protein
MRMNKQEIEKAIEILQQDKMSFEKVNHGGFDSKIKAFDLAIIALQQQFNGWIPVENRLPERERRFSTYVTMKYREGTEIFSAKVLWECGKFKWFNGKPLSEKWVVIAWKPELLPRPYQEV